ncbi:MAG: hypothetical protein ACI9UA_002195, partial [Pseudoalteromonas tetraodonis]
MVFDVRLDKTERYFDNDTGCPQAFLNHCIEQDTHSHFFEIYGNRELAIGLLCL